MSISDFVPYVLAAAPPSVIALTTGVDSPDMLLTGAGSGAISVIAVAAVRLLAAHKEHLEAQRRRWAAEDEHHSKAEAHRQAQRLNWQQSNEQARDLHAAVTQVVTAVNSR